MMPDRFVESVLAKYKTRSEAGFAKYGVTLERSDLSYEDWLTHLQEELMDSTLYLEVLVSKLKEVRNGK
jgi:hypothetical protein